MFIDERDLISAGLHAHRQRAVARHDRFAHAIGRADDPNGFAHGAARFQVEANSHQRAAVEVHEDAVRNADDRVEREAVRLPLVAGERAGTESNGGTTADGRRNVQ